MAEVHEISAVGTCSTESAHARRDGEKEQESP